MVMEAYVRAWLDGGRGIAPERSGAIRASRGRAAQVRGVLAEEAACLALERAGWTIKARRLRTEAGEIDIVADFDGLLAIVEVKARQTLQEAAAAVSVKQQRRLVAAAECLLAEHPGWGQVGVRFDVVLVDAGGRVRRVVDAFRQEGS